MWSEQKSVTDVLTTFWHLLWHSTEQMHGNMTLFVFILARVAWSIRPAPTSINNHLNSSPIDEVPMKAGGGAKRNVSLKQGAQVSKATQRAATTTRHRHTEKLSGQFTYQPLYSPRPARGREERGEKCCTKARFVAQKNSTTFESEHASSEAWRNPYAK